ncbi:hypothetical protein GCM10018772_50440 [Streptomyces fumanus]|uniref:Uncharacterized protein n=1 Tax=Streptomyces fumanus TaxID=67302 RepID=A0A919E4N9_9ACTN|nr:hypothetical protein GCM10018772_50440 [Streptomyces fumanus]
MTDRVRSCLRGHRYASIHGMVRADARPLGGLVPGRLERLAGDVPPGLAAPLVEGSQGRQTRMPPRQVIRYVPSRAM